MMFREPVFDIANIRIIFNIYIMKHLRLFEDFDSSMIMEIEDILVQLKDEGIEVGISKGGKHDMSLGAKILGRIVGAGKFPDIFVNIDGSSQSMPASYYSPSVYHLISFMEGEGYGIFSFSVSISSGARSSMATLYNEGKPANKSVESDPMKWIERYISENAIGSSVKKIDISFIKK